MTTANLLNVSPAKGVQVDVSKRLQEEAREVTEIFSSMMNQTMELADVSIADVAEEPTVAKTEGTEAVNDSYQRYSYKKNTIEEVQEEEQLTLSEEEAEIAEQAENNIIEVICTEYGVEEDAIIHILDSMGLSVLDLLDPKNLVAFMMQLTGVSTGEELLLDENFLKVLETTDSLTQRLMTELGVEKQELFHLLSLMKTPDKENEIVAVDSELQMSTETSEAHTVVKEEDVLQTTSEDMVHDESISMNGDKTEASVETGQVVKEEPENRIKVQLEKQEEVSGKQETILSDNHDAGADSFMEQNQNHNFNQDPEQSPMLFAQQSTVTNGVNNVPSMQLNSYMSIDTVQIMEQIAEQIKVVITPNQTSMEMQLNPENLGKIYLHISSQEGVVNAQFYATNEVVKEALESQIATLRENLNQAGVKVDAIEVTISSHEFERNLEQNQQNGNEELIHQQQNTRRRNLSADTLDDLMGVMTEEETLVAQIMKDNGNSVDFTA